MTNQTHDMHGSLPAREGERYVTARLSDGHIGVAVPRHPEKPVAIANAAHLTVDHIPGTLRQQHHLKSREEADFVVHEPEHDHDGIRFSNGAEIPLERFEPGVGITVTALAENTRMKSDEQQKGRYLGA